MRQPKTGDHVVFIADHPNQPGTLWSYGTVDYVGGGGCLVRLYPTSTTVAVGFSDWQKYMVISDFYSVKEGARYRVKKTPAHHLVARYVTKGDIVVAIERSITDGLGDTIAWRNETNRHDNTILTTPAEFIEYLEPIAGQEAVVLPQSLKKWYAETAKAMR